MRIRQIEKNFEVFDRNNMPVKCDTTRKGTKLRMQLSWDTEGASGESEWLNGILRNGYRCFAPDVDAMVRAQLTATFNGLKLPVVKMNLESFSIGDEAPFFAELRLLPTRRYLDWNLVAGLMEDAC